MHKFLQFYSQYFRFSVVVAQLVERSLPIPEICGSNPAIDVFFYQPYLKDKNKEKREREWPNFLKKRIGPMSLI